MNLLIEKNLLASTCIPFKRKYLLYFTIGKACYHTSFPYVLGILSFGFQFLRKAPRKYEIGTKTNVGHVTHLS
jgi:hypothetical protein